MEKDQHAYNDGVHREALPKALSMRKSMSAPDVRIEMAMPLATRSQTPSVYEGKEQPPAILSWKGLVVGLRSINKILLNDLSGQITTGYWAIMGPSGSGKTTLLNTLACRLDRNTKVCKGVLRMNGKPYSISELKKMAGYVMQDDLLNGNFTAFETLKYTADLRLHKELTKAEKLDRIEDVLLQMGLAHTRNTIVGSPLRKGLSGGERKRLCVAMELLTGPKLLFLDEPTSGLDSVTALSLCTKLKVLAAQCTIVNTIHQPQAKIFNLFDKLVLLKAGKLVYMGRTDKALDYFTARGYPCPALENPADHIMDCITTSHGDSAILSQAKEDKLQVYEEQEFDIDLGIEHPKFQMREVTPWVGQFAILFRRSLKEQWRKRSMMLTQLMQSVIIAVLIGTVFYQIGVGQSSMTRRQPVLFFCVVNQGVFGALVQINSFPSERMLSLRERAAGTYYASAYFLAKTTAETIAQVITPVIFSLTVYFLVGFQLTAGKFFVFTAFMVLCSLAATSLALAVSAVCRTVDMSVTVLPMMLEICRLFGGFFLSPANIPFYFKWLDMLSYVQFTYVAISINELQGLQLKCTDVQVANNTCIRTGEETIHMLGLEFLTIEKCAGILISYIVICRLIAYLGVRFITW